MTSGQRPGRGASPRPEYTQEFVERGSDRIGLQIYPEPEVADAPMVVVWPAMGVRASYYRGFAANLHAAGLAVVVADLRGTGASTPRASRRSRYGYTELVADVGAVQESLEHRFAGRTRLLLGHSLGGQAALLHLALSPDAPVDGLVLVAVGMPYWRTYPGRARYRVLSLTQGIATATAVLGYWPGWGFGGRQARGVVRDWAHTARVGRFPSIGGTDAEAALGRLRTPTLAMWVEGDGYTPQPTVDHLCDKLVAAPVRRECFSAAQAGRRLDHFSWVRAAEPVAARVAAFAAELPPRR